MLETEIEIIRVKDALQWGREILAAGTCEDPGLEARAILEGLTGLSRSSFLLDLKQEIAPALYTRYQELIRRRAENEPVAYLLGVKNFMGRDFSVDNRVLVPRPETELLVEAVIAKSEAAKHPNENNTSFKILEIGTGSGCIGISLALAFRTTPVIATDFSQGALDVARGNAERHLVQNIQFLQSNLFEGLDKETQGDFDMIVSNPPYISSSFLKTCDADLTFEPQTALDGGPDGLRILTPLIQKAPDYLKPGGFLMVEIGYDQGPAVKKLFEDAGFSSIEIKKDYNQHDRIVSGFKNGSI